MSVINTNITALIGQQNLASSKADLTTAMERLSSGLRINSAKDDAAGQAIANRMSAQVTGLAQAQRNANDGISVAQTAEGALNQINDNLQRVRELTVQAQNGTNSQSDLQSVQDEIDARLSEIDRISEQTDFNGTKVLDGSKTSIDIQVGSDDGQTITISLQNMDKESLNIGTFNVNGYAGSTLSDVSSGTIENVQVGTGSGQVAASGITIKGADGSAITATLKTDDDGNYFVQGSGSAAAVYAVTSFEVGGSAGSPTLTAVVDDNNALSQKSDDPLASLDNALSKVDNMRSDLGAIQNRFESAITNLTTTETNITAARSRIEDADYAVEVANMTRAQILQQAGTSVLAQANQVPQSVLSLLG